MTPHGYLPLLDAIARCAEVWSTDRKTAWTRLRPLLHGGQVYSCTIGANGSTYEAGRQWGADENANACETGYLLYHYPYVDDPVKQKAFVEEATLEVWLSGAAADVAHGAPDESQGRGETVVPALCAWLTNRYPAGLPKNLDGPATLKLIHQDGIKASTRSLTRAVSRLRAPSSAK